MEWTQTPPGMRSQVRVNAGQTERIASMIGGTAMILWAMLRPSKASVPLALTGGFLLFRGATATSWVYKLLTIAGAGKSTEAGLEVERAVTIQRPRAEVYRFWRDMENLPQFMSHLKEVRVLDADRRRSHWVAKAPLGQSVEWDAEILEEIENEWLEWRSLPGSQVENWGRVEFRDAPGGQGTVVHVKLIYRVPGGKAGALIASLFGESPEMQVREDLRRFKAIMEAGVAPTVIGQASGRTLEVQRERGGNGWQGGRA